MPAKIYHVDLEKQERDGLEAIVKKRKSTSGSVKRSKILLAADRKYQLLDCLFGGWIAGQMGLAWFPVLAILTSVASNNVSLNGFSRIYYLLFFFIGAGLGFVVSPISFNSELPFYIYAILSVQLFAHSITLSLLT